MGTHFGSGVGIGLTYLEGDQRGGDADLWGRTDVARPNGRSGGRVEDPGDSVGLGEQSAVNGAEADTDAKTLQHTDRCGRSGEEDEGVQIADEHACQQDHAEFPSGSSDHRCIAMLEEQARYCQGRYDS